MPNLKYFLKKTLFCAFLLLAGIISEGAIPGFDSHSDKAAQNMVWETKMRRRVEFLSDSLCEGRACGTRGGTEAAFEILRIFRKAGLLPFDGSYSQSFQTADNIRTGHNIIGMIPGSLKRPPKSYIIVGAHFDNLGTLDGHLYPGADSNASGTAALCSIADMFSSMKVLGKVYDSSVIFVAFDANCLSKAGSEELFRRINSGLLKDPVNGQTIRPGNIRMMINIDQIGSSLSPLASGRPDYLIMLDGGTVSENNKDWLSVCNRLYSTDLELSHTYYGSANFTKIFYRLSDQQVFVDHRIPSVLFTSGITMNNNKTYDSPRTLNYDVLRRRTILIFHWIERML